MWPRLASNSCSPLLSARITGERPNIGLTHTRLLSLIILSAGKLILFSYLISLKKKVKVADSVTSAGI